jgi:hypothetical protein
MSSEFSNYLSNYVKKNSLVLKKYLLLALDNRDHCISFLESSGGMMETSSDLKACEFLRDAKIFQEALKFSRKGRNGYKTFQLTELGLKYAEEIKREKLLTANYL